VVISYNINGIIIIRAIGYRVTIRLLVGYNILILISFLGHKLYFIII
jgi:hypothetical protein